jgi:hypothetical protein
MNSQRGDPNRAAVFLAVTNEEEDCMRRITGFLLALAAAVSLGCGPPSQHEILEKAEGLETKQELEAAIGAPDEVDKLGGLERWTYRAADGDVEFVITGNNVALGATQDRDDDEEEGGR